MAEILVSPGVLANENDQSFVTQQPVTLGAALIGPTVKGPVEDPVLVTTFSDYSNRFGTTLQSGSGTYTPLTTLAAQNYFANGGTSLTVARTVPSASVWTFATASILASSGSDGQINSFTLEALDKGVEFNNSGSLLANDALTSGSVENIRYEIATNNTSSGLFSLVIRRGDDTQVNKVVLETFPNLSLDETQPNYISAVIGDQTRNYNATENYIEISGSHPNNSRYIRVKEVLKPTYNFFDNAGNARSIYTASIPAVGSGSEGGAFGGAAGSNFQAQSKIGANKYYNDITSTNSQGLVGADYTNMISLLANQDDFSFNVIATPGIYYDDYSSQVTTIINNTQVRGDSIFVLDLVAWGSTITNAVNQASNLNSSYAATYWPWVRIRDAFANKNVWVPASTMIPGVFAYNDSVSEPWFAPAGINRGGLSTVITAERKVSSTNRDTLYEGNINPIATFPGTGVVVYGQKTLQRRASALDRVNVRRLLIALKSFISQIALGLVFDQNTTATRNNFLAAVNPYLESVQQRQGLFAFKVVMDSSNNTPDVIDRNQLIGQIYLQPTKTAEFIYLDFNILPTGATFPS
tara:strand:+ start:197 stop:1939 length:1743 start_codon:yes stop_codon:yes gene_type:complete